MKNFVSILCVICIMIGCIGISTSASVYGATYTLDENSYASNNIYMEKGQTISIYIEMKQAAQLNADTFTHYSGTIWGEPCNVPETKFRLKVTGESWFSGSLNKTFKMDKLWHTYGSDETVLYTFTANQSGIFNILLENISDFSSWNRTYVKKPIVAISIY